MAAATAPNPAANNLGDSPASRTEKKSGAFNIPKEYVASQNSSLPPVWFLNDGDEQLAREYSGGDRAFWVKAYGAARKSQLDQSKLLQEIRSLEIKRQAEHGFKLSVKDFQKGTKEMQQLRAKFDIEKTALEKINGEIAAKRSQNKMPMSCGLVRSHPLLKPIMVDQGGYDVIGGVSCVQSAISESLRKAYDLQLYRNDYLKAVENDKEKEDNDKKVLYDHTYEGQITEALSQINNEIQQIVTSKLMSTLRVETPNVAQELQNKPMLLNVYECVQGDPVLDLEDDDCEPPEDDEFDDEALKPGMYYSDPSDPVKIEELGDGSNGQSEKPPLPKEVHDIRAKMGGKGGPLQRYLMSLITHNNAVDPQAKKELDDLGNQLDAYSDSVRIHRKIYAITYEHITCFQEMIVQALAGFEAIKSDTTNIGFQNDYIDLRLRARWFLEQYQMPEEILDALVPPEDEILRLVGEHLKNTNPPAPTVESAPPAPTVESAPPTPTIGSFTKTPTTKPLPKTGGVGGNLHGQKTSNKTSTQKSTRKNAEPANAPPEDSEEQFAQTDATPGFVMEIEGKTKVISRICGYRRTGDEKHQLLLKRNGTNPDFKNRYIYKLVAARKFGRAREEYVNVNGKEMVTAGAKFLKEGNKLWSQAKIGGVASVQRDPNREYVNEATTFIFIKFPGETEVWIGRSYVENHFGSLQVQAQISQYMMEAGQLRSKKPSLMRAPRKSKSKPESKPESKPDSISVEEDNLDDAEEEEEEEHDSDEDLSNFIDDSEVINNKPNQKKNQKDPTQEMQEKIMNDTQAAIQLAMQSMLSQLPTLIKAALTA